ncbi:dual specificity protein phosphatase 22 [Bombina bombina]|uniref:dual specificity protein phosphatase 22 n=1 Tax=Bombina bombina TaxID=8345 RepID=UPI00235A8680|nr:dual specificity protein phosphatase 22 [Bombina bombina]
MTGTRYSNERNKNNEEGQLGWTFLKLMDVLFTCSSNEDAELVKIQHFKESTGFIHECRLKGEGCLVHCLAGVSRSVTLVVAYVMAVTNLGWDDALSAVRGARTCANPNMGFQKQLEDFGKHDIQNFRKWLKDTYGESPFLDEEEARQLIAKHKQQEAESQSAASSGRQWSSHLTSLSSLSYSTTET